jgi:hypothetical protein
MDALSPAMTYYDYDFDYDQADRLASEVWNTAGGASIWTFEWDYDAAGYDLDGNREPLVVPGGPVTYFEHGGHGLVTKIKPLGGTEVNFGYDALLRRVRMTEGAVTTYFKHDGIDLLEVSDTSGNLTKITHGYRTIAGIGSVVEIEVNGTRYYLFLDHRGTCYMILDASGDLVWAGNGNAFGDIISQTGSNPSIFWYQGQAWWKLTVNGRLHYISPTRVYDVQDGRFVERDPQGTPEFRSHHFYNRGGAILDRSSNPQSRPYESLRNDAVNVLDPMGDKIVIGGKPWELSKSKLGATLDKLSGDHRKLVLSMEKSTEEFRLECEFDLLFALMIHAQFRKNVQTAADEWVKQLKDQIVGFNVQGVALPVGSHWGVIGGIHPVSRKGTSAFEAIEEIFRGSFAVGSFDFDCNRGANTMILRAISLTVGKERFNQFYSEGILAAGPSMTGVQYFRTPSGPEGSDMLPGDKGQFALQEAPFRAWQNEYFVALADENLIAHPFGIRTYSQLNWEINNYLAEAVVAYNKRHPSNMLPLWQHKDLTWPNEVERIHPHMADATVEGNGWEASEAQSGPDRLV